jgi:hypothetical protein
VARCALASGGVRFNDEGKEMKKLSMVAVAVLVALSVGACGTVGKGKGKGKAPVAAPVVTKG